MTEAISECFSLRTLSKSSAAQNAVKGASKISSTLSHYAQVTGHHKCLYVAWKSRSCCWEAKRPASHTPPPPHPEVCAGTDESELPPSSTSQPNYFKHKPESFSGSQTQTLETRKRCCDLLFERQPLTQPHLGSTASPSFEGRVAGKR